MNAQVTTGDTEEKKYNFRLLLIAAILFIISYSQVRKRSTFPLLVFSHYILQISTLFASVKKVSSKTHTRQSQ